MLNYFKKMRQEKRAYRRYRQRVNALPDDLRQAMVALEKYLWNWAKDGSMADLLADILDMFEGAAADGLTVKEVVGDDIVAFADDLLSENQEKTWLEGQRQKLRQKAFKNQK